MSADRLRAWGREMREVHRLLRRAVEVARESVEDESDADLLAGDPLLVCWGFCTALTGHHSGEDQALFPWLAQRHPELTPVLAQLRQDHSMIEHLIGGLRRAMTDGAPTAEKLRHLDGIEAVMLTHFGYEERQLAVLLDAVTDDDPSSRTLYGDLAPDQ